MLRSARSRGYVLDALDEGEAPSGLEDPSELVEPAPRPACPPGENRPDDMNRSPPHSTSHYTETA
jgi:hypothetical protein